MATLSLTNAFVSIDANDLSSDAKSVTLDYNAEMLDDTAMGDDTKSSLGGLKDWSVSVEFHQDFASSALDSILFPLVGTVFTVIIRPDAGAVTASNPNYTGSMILETYNPVNGAVGEIASTTVSLKAAGTLSRATS